MTQIIEIDPDSCACAPRGATSDFVDVREKRIVEHPFLAPEFGAIADHRHLALELVDCEVDILSFKVPQRSSDSVFLYPRFQILELDSFGLQ